MIPSPNALTLEQAHARMRVATVEQLRAALEAQARGEAIGCYADAIRPFLALGAA